jgi:hypothetical protein
VAKNVIKTDDKDIQGKVSLDEKPSRSSSSKNAEERIRTTVWKAYWQLWMRWVSVLLMKLT